MWSRKFLWLSVALLFFSSVISWGEVCLSDEEYNELNSILTTLDQQSIADGQELRQLKANLSTAQSELIGSLIALDSAKTSLVEAGKSLQGQRLEAILVTIVSSICLGVVGYAIGLLSR